MVKLWEKGWDGDCANLLLGKVSTCSACSLSVGTNTFSRNPQRSDWTRTLDGFLHFAKYLGKGYKRLKFELSSNSRHHFVTQTRGHTVTMTTLNVFLQFSVLYMAHSTDDNSLRHHQEQSGV